MAVNDTPLVIDNGSYSIKTGHAGGMEPSLVIPIVTSTTEKMTSPMKNSVITDKYRMGEIWKDVMPFSRWDTSIPRVLISEPPLNPQDAREFTVQSMIEKFNIPGLFLANKATLGLYANGLTSGIVVDSGYECTYIAPIDDGWCVSSAVSIFGVGGKQSTEYMSEVIDIEKAPNIVIIEKIKQKLCYVSTDYVADLVELRLDSVTEYKLPDGTILEIPAIERLQCVEANMFLPNKKLGIHKDAIHNRLNEVILKCDMNIQNDMYGNIVLCGGNTSFKGFDERLLKEMKELYVERDVVNGYLRLNCPSKGISADIEQVTFRFTSPILNVMGINKREYSTWRGGSILAALSSFDEMWIERMEYEEVGPGIVHRKCIL